MIIISLVVINLILSAAVIFFLLQRFTELKKDLSLVQVDKEKEIARIEALQEKTERNLRDEFSKSREELNNHARQSREELALNLKNFSESLSSHMRDLSQLQQKQLETFSRSLNDYSQQNLKQLNQLGINSREDLTRMRDLIEERLRLLQDDNNQKLEKMRETVDEKLQGTLEKRLGESFKHVSQRLEQVHKGLGEMQSLATGVGDLKKVLTNVKTRGTFGEIQLEALLESVLAPEQFERNVQVKKGSLERVDFAIKLPGPEENAAPLLLPIDSKFPQEDYHRLVDAQEKADLAEVEAAVKQLEKTIMTQARSIRDKYISPPATTDFAILFLPTEGLYAEALRLPGLADKLQRDLRIIVAGPTTLAALLNSLQMGFRTLAIQKRSGEVWKLLATVKEQFGQFGDVLEKTQKKLQEASNHIDKATSKSRNIERKLGKVEKLSDAETSQAELLGVELN